MRDIETSTMPPTRELTLIVAATSKMGIGLKGTLPWTGLKKEMAYFARVTKRVEKPGNRNAVIMGRKTWDSIPPKFRPLRDRTNVVISRSHPAFSTTTTTITSKESHHQASSLQSALEGLSAHSSPSSSSSAATPTATQPTIEKIFIIGGGEIYAAASQLREARRILLTRVLDDFECDTFFPVRLGEDDWWVQRHKDELDDWVGEVVPEGVQVEGGGDVEGGGEGGTRYVFEMWERVD